MSFLRHGEIYPSDGSAGGDADAPAYRLDEVSGWLFLGGLELRHTFATRLSAGGVADHFVTQLLRQGDSAVFKRYSQAKLKMMREALAKLDRGAAEHSAASVTVWPTVRSFRTVLVRFAGFEPARINGTDGDALKTKGIDGRGGGIRTPGFLLPKQALNDVCTALTD